MSRMTHSKCGDCRNYFKCDSACENDFACADFEQQGKTLFDRITSSPEVLAEEFVEPYTRWGEDGYLETLWRTNFRELSGMLFDTREETIAATVAKLKEVEK